MEPDFCFYKCPLIVTGIKFPSFSLERMLKQITRKGTVEAHELWGSDGKSLILDGFLSSFYWIPAENTRVDDSHPQDGDLGWRHRYEELMHHGGSQGLWVEMSPTPPRKELEIRLGEKRET